MRNGLATRRLLRYTIVAIVGQLTFNACDAPESPPFAVTSGAVVFAPETTADGRLSPDLTLYSRSLALVIGVDRYAHLPALHSAERDAVAMAKTLKNRGFSVMLLLGKQATRARIAALLGDRLPKVSQVDDRVLVYFAGHGVSVGAGPEAVGYLMPVGGDPNAPAATGLAMTEVVRWFGRYPAKHVMLLADACYGGLALSTRGAGLRPAMERYLEAITSRPMRAVLVGGGAQEQVNEWRGHGLFTHFVLRGLDGAADGNNDGVITSDELVAFVKPEVARVAQRQWGTEQHPQAGRSGEGDFVFLSPRPRQTTQPGQRGQSRQTKTRARPIDPGNERQTDRSAWPALAATVGKDPGNATASPRPASTSPTPTGWVRIPAGTAHIGTPVDTEPRDPDEAPRVVEISGDFWMQTTEVTQGEWRQLRGHNPAEFVGCGDTCPVEDVTFWDALAFANARSKAAKLPPCYRLSSCERAEDGGLQCRSATLTDASCAGYRLPTEAEWEYAARAGSRDATYAGPLRITERRRAPSLDAIAWHGGHNDASYPGTARCVGWRGRSDEEPGCGTRPVGQLRANAWGLHDMIGNVWEWTWPRPDTGQVRTVTTGHAVSRGGGWYNDARDCRAANRFVLPANAHYFNVGLRLVRRP